MRTALLVLAVLVVVVPLCAKATTCPEPKGGSSALAAIDAEQRLEFIRGKLAAEVGPTKMWMGAWGGGYVVLTAAQLAITPFLNDEDKKDFYVGAAGSAVGLAAIVILPPGVISDQPALEAKLASGGDVCAQLAAAEETLAKDADDQSFARSWFFHVGNVLFNGLLGVIIGLFDLGHVYPKGTFPAHAQSGLINGLIGAAVGEAMIFTTPWGLISTHKSYLAGTLAPAKVGVQLRVLPMAVREGAGVQLALQF